MAMDWYILYREFSIWVFNLISKTIMKAIKNIFLVLGILVTVSGCDYLDSEPEKKGTLEEAFASVNSARNFLYACYSFMPESSDHNGEPQFNGASDEVCITSQWLRHGITPKSRILGLKRQPIPYIIIGLISKVLHNRVVVKRTIFMALFVNAIHF